MYQNDYSGMHTEAICNVEENNPEVEQKNPALFHFKAERASMAIIFVLNLSLIHFVWNDIHLSILHRTFTMFVTKCDVSRIDTVKLPLSLQWTKTISDRQTSPHTVLVSG